MTLERFAAALMLLSSVNLSTAQIASIRIKGLL
jgi:hypothetical protein